MQTSTSTYWIDHSFLGNRFRMICESFLIFAANGFSVVANMASLEFFGRFLWIEGPIENDSFRSGGVSDPRERPRVSRAIGMKPYGDPGLFCCTFFFL